ncbi:MAG: PAS domain-containing protein, partial [Planctomycetes bacterium]|nr:PAS domain-containing protein [Planctomycetota bacterium]
NEAAKIQSMVEQMPTNVLLADTDFRLTYMNEQSRKTLKTLEAYLPDRVDNLLGKSIDIFHKNPEHQRKLLSDPRNLPHRANIQVGPEILSLQVDAVRDGDGNYIGPMVSWSVVTEQLRVENEAAKIQSMVEEMPINILMADLDFKLTYMNKTSVKTLKSIEHLLPDRVDNLVGRSIDIFHKNPEMQRRLLSDPNNLPHRAEIILGDEVLALTVAAVRDKAGKYIGPMVAWEVVTQKVRTRNTLTETSVSLDNSSETLTQIAASLASASEETSAQAQAVAAASEQVHANMETVASSSEEMSATIKEIAANAGEAARVAGQAVSEAQGANETVAKLGESSTEIGNVIKAITSIAQQTNLLALNATIEAARAGEAGK